MSSELSDVSGCSALSTGDISELSRVSEEAPTNDKEKKPTVKIDRMNNRTMISFFFLWRSSLEISSPGFSCSVRRHRTSLANRPNTFDALSE